MAESIRINERVSIPVKELRFKFSRSSGPGGQHVNTTDTRVTLLFNVDKTRSLTELQKVAVKGKLRRRISADGVLRISRGTARSQKANKDAVLDRFIELMQWALEPVTPRKATMPTLSSIRRVSEEKKRRSTTKQQRRKPDQNGW